MFLLGGGRCVVLCCVVGCIRLRCEVEQKGGETQSTENASAGACGLEVGATLRPGACPPLRSADAEPQLAPTAHQRRSTMAREAGAGAASAIHAVYDPHWHGGEVSAGPFGHDHVAQRAAALASTHTTMVATATYAAACVATAITMESVASFATDRSAELSTITSTAASTATYTAAVAASSIWYASSLWCTIAVAATSAAAHRLNEPLVSDRGAHVVISRSTVRL